MTRFTPRVVLAGALAVALAVTGLAITLTPATQPYHAAAANARDNRAAFHDGMRQLWEDHIVWTRMFIVSAAADLPDLSVATDRLLRNQDDIGDAVKPFYGEAGGEQLSALLREHILGAAALLTAAKAGDSAGVEAASAAWYANADEIAAFLNEANPRQWDLTEMKAMMRDHLDLTLAEAVARLQGRYADDAAAYDQIHVQILHMADMLSDGIIAQFPSKFAR
jgi:hypothetical protein